MKKIELLLTGLLLGVACTEWQEPQIDEEYIEVLTPRDSLRTDVATLLFYWYEIPGAARYELQIVTPSFDRIDRLVLDTNVSGNKFEVTLTPGTYEWSIRGYNNSSSTGYTAGVLFIDSTLDLSNQKVQVYRPADRDTTNSRWKLFDWQSLYNAENYHFELWTPDLNGQLILSRDTERDSLYYLVESEGNYYWRVRAENVQSNTVYSARSFYIDTTRPAPPVLNQPADGDFISTSTIEFKWSRGNDGGSSVTDTFYLATDSNLVNLRRKIITSGNSVSLDTISPGTYYWGMRSGDKAGNRGNYSNIRQFTRQ